MLGLYIVAFEKYKEEVEQEFDQKPFANWSWLISLEACEKSGLNAVPVCSNDAFKYIKNLRHSLAHYNIEYISQNNQITHLKVWNKPQRRPDEVNWLTIISLDELRKLVKGFAQVVDQIIQQTASSNNVLIQNQVSDMQQYLDSNC